MFIGNFPNCDVQKMNSFPTSIFIPRFSPQHTSVVKGKFPPVLPFIRFHSVSDKIWWHRSGHQIESGVRRLNFMFLLSELLVDSASALIRRHEAVANFIESRCNRTSKTSVSTVHICYRVGTTFILPGAVVFRKIKIIIRFRMIFNEIQRCVLLKELPKRRLETSQKRMSPFIWCLRMKKMCVKGKDYDKIPLQTFLACCWSSRQLLTSSEQQTSQDITNIKGCNNFLLPEWE